MYVNNKYVHYRIDHQIRINSHAKQEKDFLCGNYSWTSYTFHDINWKIIHNANWNSLQPQEELLFDSSTTVFPLEKWKFSLNMLVHIVNVYLILLPRTTISSHANHLKT